MSTEHESVDTTPVFGNEYASMSSNPNRTRPEEPKYKVPPGWEKGEPLTVNRVSETCYQLYRSGSYLMLPGAPITREVQCLEFRSRVEMVDFQAWWDNPSTSGHNYERRGPHFHLTAGEFVEIVEEMFDLDLQEILGKRQGVDKVPAFSMSVTVKNGELARLLQFAHDRYVGEVKRILAMPDPRPFDAGEHE